MINGNDTPDRGINPQTEKTDATKALALPLARYRVEPQPISLAEPKPPGAFDASEGEKQKSELPWWQNFYTQRDYSAEHPSSRDKEDGIGCGFWGWVFLLCIPGIAIIIRVLEKIAPQTATKIFSKHDYYLVLFYFIGALIIYFILQPVRRRQRKRLAEETTARKQDALQKDYQYRLTEWHNQQKILSQQAANRAQEATQNLRHAIVSAYNIRQNLLTTLKRTNKALDKALLEFDESAFSPFWDEIERAAEQLFIFKEKTKKMGALAGEYYRLLEGRTHNFPPFPYQPSDLPSAEKTINRFKSVVRKGMVDFQFAEIWEHRKTRETIATGFGSLEAAVRSVGGSIESSLHELQASVTGGLDRLALQHQTSAATIATAISSSTEEVAGQLESQRREVCAILESQNRKLDNIQRRRLPPFEGD